MSSWLPVPIEPGWATVGAALGLLVLTSGFLAAGPWAVLRNRGANAPPERPLRFRRTELAVFLRRGEPADPPTWHVYRQALRWDMGFAALYGIGLTIVLDGTLRVAYPGWEALGLLVYLPAVASAADIVENLGLMKASRRIGSGVDPGAGVLALVSVATPVKWLAVIGSLVLIAVGAVVLGIRGSPA